VQVDGYRITIASIESMGIPQRGNLTLIVEATLIFEKAAVARKHSGVGFVQAGILSFPSPCVLPLVPPYMIWKPSGPCRISARAP
jgi:hypothetical protein